MENKLIYLSLSTLIILILIYPAILGFSILSAIWHPIYVVPIQGKVAKQAVVLRPFNENFISIFDIKIPIDGNIFEETREPGN